LLWTRRRLKIPRWIIDLLSGSLIRLQISDSP
jgi:hypothetical protein